MLFDMVTILSVIDLGQTLFIFLSRESENRSKDVLSPCQKVSVFRTGTVSRSTSMADVGVNQS